VYVGIVRDAPARSKWWECDAQTLEHDRAGDQDYSFHT
jgi:hypothetical protein